MLLLQKADLVDDQQQPVAGEPIWLRVAYGTSMPEAGLLSRWLRAFEPDRSNGLDKPTTFDFNRVVFLPFKAPWFDPADKARCGNVGQSDFYEVLALANECGEKVGSSQKAIHEQFKFGPSDSTSMLVSPALQARTAYEALGDRLGHRTPEVTTRVKHEYPSPGVVSSPPSSEKRGILTLRKKDKSATGTNPSDPPADGVD